MERDSLLDKIRALMSKTVANGCTEHEALAALDKARAMMDAYEVTDADLQLSKAESAILRKEPPGSKDLHGIKRGMATAVAKFCDCKVWRSPEGLTFCGLKSDAQFATWLLDNLTQFVKAELMQHLIGSIASNSERRLVINGFVIGCTSRISARLNELCARSETAVVNTNARALVTVKSTAIADKMKALGIHLRSSRSGGRQYDRDSFAAGRAAGDRASFGRPVSGANGTLRLR
jgi:hypothetical protein